jgi:hypothetical protein
MDVPTNTYDKLKLVSQSPQNIFVGTWQYQCQTILNLLPLDNQHILITFETDDLSEIDKPWFAYTKFFRAFIQLADIVNDFINLQGSFESCNVLNFDFANYGDAVIKERVLSLFVDSTL